MTRPPDAPSRTEPTPRAHRAWSVFIGRVAGIPIFIHGTFFLLLAFVAWSFAQRGEPVARGLLLVITVFACVVLHELGHALTARRYGIRTEDIVLYPIGGVARLRSLGEGWQEFWIALAGPAVNLAIAVGLYVMLTAVGYEWVVQIDPARPLRLPFWQWVLSINIVLLVFNLIPAFPMDGGRVLRAVLTHFMGNKSRATAVAAGVGQVFAVLFMLVGLFANPVLMLIGVFIFFAAGQESVATQSISLMQGRRVRDAMITRFDVLQHGDSLARAAELLLKSNQQDFPVFGGGEVIGLLERRALISGLSTHGRDHYVAEVMSREFLRLAPDDDLEAALAAIREGRGAPVLIFDGDQLVGYITQENLAEYLMVEQARRQA